MKTTKEEHAASRTHGNAHAGESLPNSTLDPGTTIAMLQHWIHQLKLGASIPDMRQADDVRYEMECHVEQRLKRVPAQDGGVDPCPLCDGTGRIETKPTPDPPSDDGGWNDATRQNLARVVANEDRIRAQAISDCFQAAHAAVDLIVSNSGLAARLTDELHQANRRLAKAKGSP